MEKNVTKKTKRQVFVEILNSEYGLSDEHIEFITHEIELLDKKRSQKKKKEDPTVEKIKELILDNLDSPKTITEMQKSIKGLGEFTNQKISSIVKKMVESGEVERMEVKGKAYFSVALSLDTE